MRKEAVEGGGERGRSSSPSAGEEGYELFFQEPDFGDRRLVSYVALAFFLLTAAMVLGRFEYGSGPYIHTLLETVATLFAFVVGGLALVRFYSRRRSTYLFLGTGFLGTSLLDGYHTVVTSPFLSFPDAPGLADLTAWSWTGSRVFLSLFLFVSWWAWHQEKASGAARRRPVEEYSVYTTAGGLTLVMFVFFSRMPLASAYHPDLWISRPGELVPGAFFALALLGYLWKGAWRRDPFEHWLVVALILSVATHLCFLAFSSAPHDLASMAAHFLKIASYVAVLVGLMASVYVTFRREGEASATVLAANTALAHEIGVRREAERVLQESEERLQDFLDNVTDLIQSTDETGRLIYVNEAWKRTLGYDDEDLEELHILSVVHPDSRDGFRRTLKKVFEGEEVSDLEVILRTKDGRAVICTGSSNCRFEGGRPVATRSILRNVTDERRSADELAHSQANVRALFESTGDSIWSVSRDLRLITFNTAFALTVEAITRRAPSIGDPIDAVVPSHDAEWFRGCYERALAGTRFSAVREEDLDGQTRVYELFFNPIEGVEGPAGVVVFSKDITRRRRVEEALKRAKQEAEEANQAKSQFMANMSHELRTPLNSVIGFANILLKNKSGRLEARELGFLDRILANGKHLLNLINEILDLSKIEAGQMELELESVDLPVLVLETLSQLEGQIGSKPVELRGDIQGEPAPLLADPGKLKQVLINLVGNALKFTEAGEVTVRIETDSTGRIPERIRVRDTGVGIPQERLESVFEAFQQADGSTTRRFGGTGLGLTISRSLCALMGYRVTVESEVGEGSTFTIHLAAAEKREEQGIKGLDDPAVARWAPPRFEVARELRDKTVLVVDDEPDSRTVLAHYLEELGCRVVTAVDGVDGMETARREHPDLITVDLMMPRMNGWEMLRALEEDPELRDIPAVVVSIVPEEGAGRFLGAVDLLSKPVDRAELVRVLRRNMSRDAGRILLVDANPDTRLILQRYLREAGLEVHTVENGEAALAFLREHDADLILLDLLMPVMDGLKTLQRLREEPDRRTMPVVVLTAKDLSEGEERLLADHAVGVIPKNDEVEERLREVLDAYFRVQDGPGVA